MSESETKAYTFHLPKDIADLFDKFCAVHPKSPVDNVASRCMREGIDAVLTLHPNMSEEVGHTPHRYSSAKRIAANK